MTAKMSKDEQRKALAEIGSQGMASLAVLVKMLTSLRAKGILADVEVTAILDAAVESVESAPASGSIAASASRQIRRLLDHFQTDAVSPPRH